MIELLAGFKATSSMENARIHFLRSDNALALQDLYAAVAYQNEVLSYNDGGWKQNRQAFTDVLIQAFTMAWEIGHKVFAKKLYEKAHEWSQNADNCTHTQRREIETMWKRLNRNWFEHSYPEMAEMWRYTKRVYRLIGAYEFRNTGFTE